MQPKEVICSIKGYSKKGHAVALDPDSNKTIEIPSGIRNEQVKAKIWTKRKRRYIADLLEVLEPSSARLQPRCKHFERCGGCTWQQMQYDQQLQEKQEIAQKLFPEVAIAPIIGSDPWHYRNKMEFTFSQSKAGEKFLGLVVPFSKGKAINLEECHLVDSWYMQALAQVRQWWDSTPLQAYHPYSNTGSLLTLTLRESQMGKNKMVILEVSGNPDYSLSHTLIDSFKASLTERFPDDDLSIFIRVKQAIKGKETSYFEMHLCGEPALAESLTILDDTYSLQISPAAFFQPNTKQAEKIYAKAIELASPQKDDFVFDLYCGIGSIGMSFAKYVKEVVGIERNLYSVVNAKENIAINNIENMRVLHGSVEQLMMDIVNDKALPDIVILDPPRAGIGPKMIKYLKEMLPKKIVYISCNPLTQSTDIKELSDCYSIEAMQPVDQFPQTHHFENIAILKHS